MFPGPESRISVNFDFSFNFSKRYYVLFVASSFLVDYSQTPQNIKNLNTFPQEKLNPLSTFNPGLVLKSSPGDCCREKPFANEMKNKLIVIQSEIQLGKYERYQNEVYFIMLPFVRREHSFSNPTPPPFPPALFI